MVDTRSGVHTHGVQKHVEPVLMYVYEFVPIQNHSGEEKHAQDQDIKWKNATRILAQYTEDYQNGALTTNAQLHAAVDSNSDEGHVQTHAPTMVVTTAKE